MVCGPSISSLSMYQLTLVKGMNYVPWDGGTQNKSTYVIKRPKGRLYHRILISYKVNIRNFSEILQNRKV